MGVWKDDNANTVSERIIKQSGAVFRDTKEQRLKVRQLSQIVEQQINSKIQQVDDVMKKHKLEMKKVEFQMAQLGRDKRLDQAAKNQAVLNTGKRLVEKEIKKEAKVIGNLSIIVGPNRRGDIVVREGDDLKQLVKNFVALYGLKKEVAPTIQASLQQLVDKNQKRKKN